MEKRLRMNSCLSLNKPFAGSARTFYGESTGGWESFAVQILYPEEYNGCCWSFCPDSLDFCQFQHVNLYAPTNAYYSEGIWTKNRLGSRRVIHLAIYSKQWKSRIIMNELARGSRGRSGGQWDV